MSSIGYEASEIHGIVGLVAAGPSVAPVPASIQAVTIASAVYRALFQPKTTIALGACWRCEDDSPTLERFLEQLPEASARLKPHKPTWVVAQCYFCHSSPESLAA